jgi:hypothetical protein
MTKHTILFLAANPNGTNRLALEQEARAIQAELDRSTARDRFELVTRWAAEPIDLLRELGKLKPTIVHFSGHGRGQSGDEHHPGQPVIRNIVAGRVGEPEGLYFHGHDGRAQVVSTEAFVETFGAAGASVKVVVLNACYSEVQAQALLAHVDYVVGMAGSIRDDAAKTFAIGFYCGLGESQSVTGAHRYGCAAIKVEGLPDGDRPRLAVRNGADPDHLVLAADPS